MLPNFESDRIGAYYGNPPTPRTFA